MGPALPRRHQGFNEWKKLDPKGKTKQACAVDMANGDEMVMAGLWSRWRDPANGERASGWSSLTTPWGFPCCVRFPCVHAAANTPV